MQTSVILIDNLVLLDIIFLAHFKGAPVSQHVVIVVPTFNNAGTLRETFEAIPLLRGFKKSVVIVDDGSSDDTHTIAAEFTNHLIRHNENCGVGVATRSAFSYIATSSTLARAKYLIKLDGDGQHNPRYIPQVLQELESGADLVICSRFHHHSDQVGTPHNRRMLNHVFADLCSAVTGWRITDARSGFIGMRLEHLRPITEQLCVKRYGIPMNILLGLWKYKPDALVECISHPAIYGGKTLTAEHRRRYEQGGETPEQIEQRFVEAWDAFSLVCRNFGVEIECFKKLVDNAMSQACYACT